MSSITFKLPEELKQKIEADAVSSRRSVSDTIRVFFEEKYGIKPTDTIRGGRRVIPTSKPNSQRRREVMA